MGKKYEQLKLEERCEIARLYRAGQSLRQIASAMDRAASTVARELKRNIGSGGYVPGYADEMAWSRRWRGSRLVRQLPLREFVLEHLAMGWSPEQVAGRLALGDYNMRISHESIYRFIYAQYARTKDGGWRHYLPRAKFKRGFRGRKGGGSSIHIKDRRPIHERPQEVQSRKEYGHWEADLMMFSDKKHNLLVAQERKSRFIKLALQENKKSENIAARLLSWFKPMPQQLRQTLTQDNGTEFSLHHKLNTSINMQTYFCNPHSPWQKGGIENMNGRLRRFLPLKTDITTLKQHDIAMLEKIINSTPRKCLGFKTPAELFYNQLLHFKCESTGC